jgi:predicted  nucleic acid-binding Zn-ribbon protein
VPVDSEKNYKLEIYDQFLESVSNKEIPKKRLQKKVLSAIEKQWNSLPYSLLDTCIIYQSKINIFKQDLPFVVKLFQLARKPIGHSEKKNGRNAIYQKFKKYYHKPSFQQFFEDFYDKSCEKHSIKMSASVSKQTLDDIINEDDIVTALFLIEKSTNRNKWVKLLKKHYLTSYCESLITLYYFACEENIEKVMTRQVETKETKHKDLKALKKEVDELKQHKKQYEKKQRQLRDEIIQHKNEINRLKQKNAQAEKRMNEVLEQSDRELSAFIIQTDEEKKKEKEALQAEIATLKERVLDEQEFYEQHIQVLVQLLYDAQKSYYNDHEEIAEKEDIELNLNGQKVAFIGGNHSRKYVRKIKEYNGNSIFVPVDDYNLIPGAVSSADVVFFLTDVVGHKHFRCVYKETKRHDTPLKYINSRGLATFERELKEYIVECCHQ